MLSIFTTHVFAGETNDTVAPNIGIAVVIFVSALSYVFLPETKNTELPQTIAEAKNLNRCEKIVTLII